MDGELRRAVLAAVHVPLTSGPVPMVVVGAAIVAVVWLLIRARRLRFSAIASAGALAAVGTATTAVIVEWLWKPFWDGVPIQVYLWTAAALFFGAVAVASSMQKSGSTRGGTSTQRTGWIRVFSAAAGVVVVVAACVQTNVYLGDYPTVAAVLGHPPLSYADMPVRGGIQAQGGTRGQGEVTEVTIPGVASGFVGRPASIYLPPAYLADSGAGADSSADAGAVLPVLVLLTGQPGQVTDWITGGNLTAIMDDFAAEHDGLAPVVVMADALGSFDANPMCMDSRLGNVATYLSVDVPAWVKANLRVSSDPTRWAIGGFSYGGTCGLQTALTAPDVYRTFLDFSGEDEQRTGTHAESVVAAFGDDSTESDARFDAVTPLAMMARREFTDVAGAFAAGSDDVEFRPQTERTYAAARDAGMDVHYSELPGGHSMDVWSPALAQNMDWLARRLDLVP